MDILASLLNGHVTEQIRRKTQSFVLTRTKPQQLTMAIINTGFGAYPKVYGILTKSAKSFDLALKKKIKQNKKFWLSA
ncbi:hypothetical protein OO009_15600 [Flavobacteriaceae bacterium KMM 6897]|nr:hypothetical protein [Flavobacteriaceae bacterium KMM 6897]